MSYPLTHDGHTHATEAAYVAAHGEPTPNDGVELAAREWNAKHAPGTRTAGEIEAAGPSCGGTRTDPHRCIVTQYAGPSTCLSDWRLAIGIARGKDERKAAGRYSCQLCEWGIGHEAMGMSTHN